MKRITSLFILGIFSSVLYADIVGPQYHKASIEALFDSLIIPKTDLLTPHESPQELVIQAQSHVRNKNFNAAIETYNKALVLDVTSIETHYALANAFLENNQIDEALETFKKVISLDNKNILSHLHCAKIYVKKNDNHNAKIHFQAVIDLDNAHKEATTELARILCDEQNFDESIQLLEKLRAHYPDDIAILFQLANTLNTANYIDESLIIYNYLYAKYPQSSAITYNIAYTLKKLGRIAQALEFYNKTLELSPEHAEAHFSRGLAYLATGNFKEGWEEYEWRWKRDTQHMEKRNLSKPLWDGSDLHGKTILLHAEQGLGDTFQFIRYAKIARDKGGVVIAAVQNPLVDILSLCPYIDRVIPLTTPLPLYDVHAPLLSLPHILQTTEETIPCEIPYLYAHTQLVEYWREKLSADKNFKIGICWQGNPNYNTPFLRTVVAAKSIKLKQFEPLFNVPGVSVYNLQKMAGEEQLHEIPSEWNLINFDENFDKIHGRFMDTAAVIKNLDLIITVDTGLAHIAAALGAPVWTFIPNPPDWRWMLDRRDTPWYPNMILFRQPRPGDWDSVIQEIAQKLQLLVEQNNHSLSQQPLGDIIDTIIRLTIETMHHRTKTDRTNDIQTIQNELIQRNIDELVMKKIKEYALELGKIHHQVIRVAHEMQQEENPFSQTYITLAQEYCRLNAAREDIKNAINSCS